MRAGRRLLLAPLLGVATAFAALSVDACGGDSTASSAPPPLPTGTAPVRDAAVADAAPPPMIDASPQPVDAGAQARHFTGSLAATAVTGFGGTPYCKYTITLKQIEVDITLGAAGVAAGATVSDLAVEANVQPCPNPPADATIQKYTLASSLKLPTGGVHLELAPDPANQPKATLVIEGDFSSDHATPTFEWHRTDQKAPLDWRVTATVPLDRQSP